MRIKTIITALTSSYRETMLQSGQQWRRYSADIIRLSSTFKVIQGHWCRNQWKTRMRLPISD